MGRCGSCQAQTQLFCFVHQEFICYSCLAKVTTIHSRCVVGTYREFLKDNSYEWPPICKICNQPLIPDGDHIRRPCLHIEHVKCIEKLKPPDFPCATCAKPLFPDDTSECQPLLKVIQTRCGSIPAIETHIPKPQLKENKVEADSINESHGKQHETINHVNEKREIETEKNMMNGDHSTSKSSESTSIPIIQTNHFNYKSPSELNGIPINTIGTKSKIPAAPTPLPYHQVHTNHPHSTSPSPSPSYNFQIQQTITSFINKLRNVKINVSNSNGLSNSFNNNINNNDDWSTIIVSVLRKTWKEFSRRVLEIKNKTLTMFNSRQIVIGLLFTVCIGLIMVLGNNNGRGNNASIRNTVDTNFEDNQAVFLPNVRVNPALMQHALSEKEREIRKNVKNRVWRQYNYKKAVDGRRDARHDDRKRVRS